MTWFSKQGKPKWYLNCLKFDHGFHIYSIAFEKRDFIKKKKLRKSNKVNYLMNLRI